MKRSVLIFLAIFAFAFVASAQPRAIGVRATYGGEISYQHYMGGSDFVEADLGFAVNGGMVATAIYDIALGQSGPFTIYAGPGAMLTVGKPDCPFFIPGIAGQLGVEYRFNIPLGLSFDWRPGFNFIGKNAGWYRGLALSVRYMF